MKETTIHLTDEQAKTLWLLLQVVLNQDAKEETPSPDRPTLEAIQAKLPQPSVTRCVFV